MTLRSVYLAKALPATLRSGVRALHNRRQALQISKVGLPRRRSWLIDAKAAKSPLGQNRATGLHAPNQAAGVGPLLVGEERR